MNKRNFGTALSEVSIVGSQWLLDRCLVQGGDWVSSSLLYNEFKDYLEANDIKIKHSKILFGKFMKSRFHKKRTNRQSGYLMDSSSPYLQRYIFLEKDLKQLFSCPVEISKLLDCLKKRSCEYLINPSETRSRFWLDYGSPSQKVLCIKNFYDQHLELDNWHLRLDVYDASNGLISDSGGNLICTTVRTIQPGHCVDGVCKLEVLSNTM